MGYFFAELIKTLSYDKKLLLFKCLPDALPGKAAITAEILAAAIISDLVDEQVRALGLKVIVAFINW